MENLQTAHKLTLFEALALLAVLVVLSVSYCSVSQHWSHIGVLLVIALFSAAGWSFLVYNRAIYSQQFVSRFVRRNQVQNVEYLASVE